MESMIKEAPFQAKSGLLALILGVPGFIAMGVLSIVLVVHGNILLFDILGVVCAVLSVPCSILVLCGLFIVNPNEARVLTLFGRYQGTVHQTGLWFANPFMLKQKISVKVRNFDSDKLKVNDLEGNPIEIGAVVVWKVVDTAEALLEVDDYEDFVKVQSEAALRNMATQYPYDSFEEGGVALRSHTAEIAEQLKKEVQDRLEKAGVEVLEARISHLAYAQEIASAMLQRQQASAIIAARTRIVEGAVGMVEMALEKLGERNIVQLDEERKAQMVSNLLVVLCSDKATQPVVNTGSVY